jgi:hypothetical protein
VWPLLGKNNFCKEQLTHTITILHFSTLRTRPMRPARGSAIFAHQELRLLHRQMRTPIARLAMGMMFGWYARHKIIK